MNKTVKRILIGAVLILVVLASIHVALNWESIGTTLRQLHGG